MNDTARHKGRHSKMYNAVENDPTNSTQFRLSEGKLEIKLLKANFKQHIKISNLSLFLGSQLVRETLE